MAPHVDGVIDDLRLEVNKLSTLKLEVGKISKYWERTLVDGPSATPGVFAAGPALEIGKISKSASAPASPTPSLHDSKPVFSPTCMPAGSRDFKAALRSPVGIAANRPNGHRVEFGNREGAFGVVTTLIPPPGKGTFSCHPSSPFPLPRPSHSHRPPPQPGGHYESVHHGGMGNITIASFPSSIFHGSKGITQNFGLNKLCITLSFTVSSPLFGFKLPQCISRALQNAGSLPWKSILRKSLGLNSVLSYCYALPGMSMSFCCVAYSKFGKLAPSMSI